MRLEFHFDYRSPYSFLAYARMGQAGVAPDYCPFDILELMQLVGNVPTTVTCKPKGQYAMKDLQRWADRSDVRIVRNSHMAAIDARYLLRATLAARQLGPIDAAVGALFDAMWSTGTDIREPAAVLDLMIAAGVDPHIKALMEPENAHADELDAATRAAAQRGIFGSPTYFVGDEMYFGNDRLDFALAELGVEP